MCKCVNNKQKPYLEILKEKVFAGSNKVNTCLRRHSDNTLVTKYASKYSYILGHSKLYTIHILLTTNILHNIKEKL